ncbi:AP-4 complex subunit epsilon [Cryptomeria japonica]|uniref:AP-4 complex subunit epsilon n=1 Tax=Cryptomeria japonica TaxID=3369 RepID=UPI0027DA9DC3|nr:AP-4 complex subunit epsilon [Cryptomeria japonica]
MGSQGGWGQTKEFLDLVKAIGEARSKAEEERIVLREIETLKKRINEPDVPKRKMKEYIIRLVYVEMLGHDAGFGYIHAVKMTHDDSLLLKRTGYLAVTLFLNEDHDLIILIVNTIQKDLKSDNYLVACAALNAVCRLINEETIPAVLPQVVELLGHPKELVRKKAVMALHRFQQKSPSSVSHLIPRFRKRLCDNDPGVMGASLCALYDLITADANSYKDLATSFVNILKQVAEHKLPKGYDYHRTPAPFIQIKLLKILALLGAGDKQASENMYTVLGDVFRKCDPTGNIGNAIGYECICTVASIYPNSKLLEAAAEITSRFLKSDNHNLKYMGIDALGRVIKINPDFAEEHQLAVIDCLEDPDDTLKRKTLDLLYKMTKSSNVEVIVDRMISYMISINDTHYKTEIASRCIELAERFAPSNHWFIQTMNKVFEHAGDLVNIKVAHNLMRIIAEGSGEDDEDADSQLRSSAVDSYLQILDEPKLPSIFLQVICWVLGEYGTADGKYPASYIIGKLCDVAEAHSGDNVVKGYAVTAIMKVCAFEMAAGKKVELIPECHSLIDELSASHSTDLQQRAYELQALIGLEADTVESVMPLDASCEDIEVDKNLTFLNGYVQSSLEKGARPYIPENERGNIGNVNAFRTHQDQTEGVGHSLKFEAYEIPKAPVPTRAIQVSSSTSNEFEVVIDSNYARAMQLSAPVSSPANAEMSNFDGLKLRLDGVQKKWGRPTYTSSSATSASSANIDKTNNGSHVSALGEATGVQNRESSYESRHVDRRQQNEVSTEKQKLAASLFGSSSSKTDKKASATKASKPVDKKSNHIHPEKTQTETAVSAPNRVETIPQNVTATPPRDLLDLSEEVPAVKVSYDPFKELEGLLEGPLESAPAKPAASVASSSPVDLVSLYGGVSLGPTASSAPVASNILGNDLLGGAPVMQTGLSNLNAQSISSQSLPSVKKGESPQDSLHKDAVSRQVGVTPTGENPNLFRDLLS